MTLVLLYPRAYSLVSLSSHLRKNLDFPYGTSFWKTWALYDIVCHSHQMYYYAGSMTSAVFLHKQKWKLYTSFYLFYLYAIFLLIGKSRGIMFLETCNLFIYCLSFLKYQFLCYRHQFATEAGGLPGVVVIFVGI